jgi:hypothetical protein
MVGLVRIAGLSALLAAAFVITVDGTQTKAAAPDAAKKYTDRILPSDAAVEPRQAAPKVAAAHASCGAQAWPYVPQECLGGAPSRKPVRTITVERREGPAGSILVRVPVMDVASR